MKIAIIGTGISGNAASWLLHEAHDITVYEQNDVTGGHSNTVVTPDGTAVDTGFIVYNEHTYPNLIALFDHLGVPTMQTDMSFAVSKDNGALEYSGDAMLAQPANLLRPRYYAMVKDIIRFYKNASAILDETSAAAQSLGAYLETEKYSQAFIDDHLLPMAAAIWSSKPSDILSFPARSFVAFFQNHGLLMLDTKKRPQWHTVKGGSREYVQRLTAPFADRIRTGRRVTAVQRTENGVQITDQTGRTDAYDHVVMAGHADQSLSVLTDATTEEIKVLSAFPYAENTAYLHRDPLLMPRRIKTWSSWNYLSQNNSSALSVTYWMNKLQPFLPSETNLFVSLNPPFKPAADKIIHTMTYAHPQFTMDAMTGWQTLKHIQGKNRTWFCGAWCGYGFHEDGLCSGLAVAEALGGVKRPWTVTDISPAGDNARPG